MTRARIQVELEVVTPVFGGGVSAHELDEVDIIRVPTIRGHLRFWWRALCGHEFASSRELFKAESSLWGSAGKEGRRSQVDIRLVVSKRTAASNKKLTGADELYALFPARQQGPSAAPRLPGTQFCLVVDMPQESELRVRETIRAWVIFGGYGGRTRRGLGSLSVTHDDTAWLPTAATRDALTRCFGRDVFLSTQGNCDTPWLASSWLAIASDVEQDAEKAWLNAVRWLREFRQGTSSPEPAREAGSRNRPGISNWPEPDKIRHLTGKTKAHPPRYNADPAWPRAEFGLPLITRFQNQNLEPGNLTLKWKDADNRVHERLASPLIVKAMPLTGRRFVPCALWLNRANPNGKVILIDKNGEVASSAVRFGKLVGENDKIFFKPLAEKSLQAAFFTWLQRTQAATRIAP